MSLDYAILGFLSEGEHSGYDLKTRCFDREARHFWTADQAQVYRTLERLERDRFVRARTIRQRGRPDRRVYRLTQQGRSALDEWLASPHEVPPYRDPFLIKLRFGAEIPDHALVEVLLDERSARQRRLEDLRARLTEHLRSTQRPSRRDRLARMTFEATLANERAAIDWLDDCIDALDGATDRTPRAEPASGTTDGEGLRGDDPG